MNKLMCDSWVFTETFSDAFVLFVLTKKNEIPINDDFSS